MLKKIVLTGAAGYLGDMCRGPLSQMCETLVSTDIVDAKSDLHPNETFIKADIGVFDEVAALMDGVEMVVHFGSIADEASWDRIFHSNMISAYNIWLIRFMALQSVLAKTLDRFTGTSAGWKPLRCGFCRPRQSPGTVVRWGRGNRLMTLFRWS